MDADRLSKTLTQLEGTAAADRDGPDYPSFLGAECHRLRGVPIGRFSVENLRIMIGQGRGLRYLVPLAIDRLEADPFVAGDFHDGDLLLAVSRIDPAFWRARPALAEAAKRIVRRAEAETDRRARLLRDELLPIWKVRYDSLWNR